MIGIAKAAGGYLLARVQYFAVLGLAIAAGALWARGEMIAADRDRVVATADGICAAAGSAWIPAKAKDGDRGKACRAAVVDLATYRSTTIAESARIHVAAAAEQQRKADRDLAIARDAAQRLNGVAKRMEDANAKVGPDDHVGGDWFAGLNDLVGVRRPAPQ